MTYFICKWRHAFEDEAVWFYGELDESRYEVRSVQVYRDGRKAFASALEEKGTGLCEKPLPSISQINSDPEFEAVEISQQEFERAWERRRIDGGGE